MKNRILTHSKIFLLSLCFILSACDEAENLSNVSSNTKKLKSLTEELASKTEQMYHQLRSKESQEARDRNFRNMDQAKGFDDKFSKAIPYIQGFEFHLWTNTQSGFDTSEFRHQLMTDAVEEFFRTVYSDLSEIDAWDVSASSKNNSALNLFALAASLHKMNRYQDNGPFKKDYGLQKWSFLKMFKTALKNEKKLEAGEISMADIPQWQQRILYRPWKKAALDLLHLRFQILPAIAMSAINPKIQNGSFFTRLRHISFGWDGEFDKLNLPTQREVLENLEEAVRTKRFLEEMGREVVLGKPLADYFQRMEINGCSMKCLYIELNHIKKFKSQVETILEGQPTSRDHRNPLKEEERSGDESVVSMDNRLVIGM